MNFKEALKNKYSILVIIDFIMMILLIINLSMILFDWLFIIPAINHFFLTTTPDFFHFYNDTIHKNFATIDIAFVTVFFAEFLFSWILAIIQKVYYRWFFYPIFHWYDLVGCIPVDAFRFVRILRVFSILVRLQNLNIIDLTNTYFYRVLEEVSDRVVVNILEGVQDEINSGGPMIDNIINEVIRPRQEILVQWFSRRLEFIIRQDILIRNDEIKDYVKTLISESLEKNKELQTIEDSISQTINDIINKTLTDLASEKNKSLVNDTTNAILNSIEYKDDRDEINQLFKDISLDVIEVIKKQVQIQKWKQKEESEKNMDTVERKNVEFLLTDKFPRRNLC